MGYNSISSRINENDLIPHNLEPRKYYHTHTYLRVRRMFRVFETIHACKCIIHVNGIRSDNVQLRRQQQQHALIRI